ncbi:hypothetical protein HHK36_027481 [Tetracentron sinense]|uniref:Retroviral polymerase SH3-like domain-containing protein n=1 Tax=Tetracentron sinense TaxID=13715 RepID=A0A834YHK8_TETSI|nr:hypothetical protein HHK36_027481 [Tetracentron sinense]
MESEPSSTPKLSIFSFPSQSPEPPGISTPPHRTPASVPFQWEEAPGKPRACTTILPKLSSARSLELPPRLFTEIKVTNMSSPTTVLDGPYVGRSVSFSSSFRSIDRGQFGAMVCSKRDYSKERGYFGSWRKSGLKGNTDIDTCSSFVLPSSGDGGESTTKYVTPEETCSERKPKISHLGVFGSLVYAHGPKERRKKLDDKATKYIFDGYCKKVYKLYNPIINKMIVSRDVKLDKTSTWKWTKAEKQHLGKSVDFEEDLSNQERDLMDPPSPLTLTSSLSPSSSFMPSSSISIQRNPPRTSSMSSRFRGFEISNDNYIDDSDMMSYILFVDCDPLRFEAIQGKKWDAALSGIEIRIIISDLYDFGLWLMLQCKMVKNIKNTYNWFESSDVSRIEEHVSHIKIVYTLNSLIRNGMECNSVIELYEFSGNDQFGLQSNSMNIMVKLKFLIWIVISMIHSDLI